MERIEFLNNFSNKVQDYMYSSFHEINHAILNDNSNYFKHSFSQEEIATIIVLNKAFFQNLVGFFEMCDVKLPLPAFNSIRAAIEAVRLFRAFFTHDEFRKEYICNQNKNFSEKPDYEFMQKKVNQILEEQERELRKRDSIPISTLLFNHGLTRGSAVSAMHSELSKWSHLLNVNLLMPTFLENNKIYLGIDCEPNKVLDGYIKKYTEGVYIILSYHMQLFFAIEFRSEHKKLEDDIFSLYEQYIKLFY